MSKGILKNPTQSVGLYLLDRLHALGADHIFGIPGDYVLQFDKMIENHPIRLINTTRENTAGFMADAYARARGIGVACITYGVGINITNAVSQAMVESSPLVVISGSAGNAEFADAQLLHHTTQLSADGSRDLTQLEIFKKITVAQTVLDQADNAAQEIDRVLQACLLRKKPVYIELPRDQVNQPITLHRPNPQKVENGDKEALTEALAEVEHVLKHCSRPVIWAGHQVQRFGLTNQLLQFAEKYRIPIATSLSGKSTISESHPLFLGIYQGKLSQDEVSEYVEGADCLFNFGVVLNDVDTGLYTAALRQPHKVMALSEGIAVNHHHYRKISLSEFLHGLSQLDLNLRFKSEYPARLDRACAPFEAQDKSICSARVFACLESHLNAQHIIVSDFGDCLFGSADLAVDANAYFSNACFGTLGFAIPGAIGVQMAVPEKRAVCIVGDGAFQMTCTELSTAVRYGIDPIIVLLNNHGYATERPLLEGKFNDILNWKYSKIPQLLGGGEGVFVKTEKEFEKALNKALNQRGRFFLIEVDLKKNDRSPGLQRFCKIADSKKKHE